MCPQFQIPEGDVHQPIVPVVAQDIVKQDANVPLLSRGLLHDNQLSVLAQKGQPEHRNLFRVRQGFLSAGREGTYHFGMVDSLSS